MSEPLVSWYEGTNATSSEVTTKFNYGTVDADKPSPQKTIYIWNNRGGIEDVPKMEEVTFTTREKGGGTGDTPGKEVEAVRDNWFHVRVDSLNENGWNAVGKDHAQPLGTNGATTNHNAATASTWASGVDYVIGDYIKPTIPNQFIYKVTVGGRTGGNQPAWIETESTPIIDGTVTYEAVRIVKKPLTQEILGLANNALTDGSNATLSGGNFVKITVFAEVPPTAKAGKNTLVSRVSYRYV